MADSIKIDPITGERVEASKGASAVKIDPITGERVVEVKATIDPVTGERATASAFPTVPDLFAKPAAEERQPGDD